MKELIDQEFQLDVIEMLTPKIKLVLKQTDLQNRDDLEQDIALMIIKAITEKEFKRFPGFFELLEK